MAKAFFEVFPTLKLNIGVQDIMGQTTVERISATKRKDFLRIYIHSSRLILKEDIVETEKAIKKQLFPNANMIVKIYEKFELSGQYNPERLMDIYRDSILTELKEYSHIEYNAFRTAELTYPDANTVVMNIDDTVINRSKEEELVRIIEKILVERCGFSVAVNVAYREAATGKFSEDDELRLQMKVAEIYERVNRGRTGKNVDGGEVSHAGDSLSMGSSDGGTMAASAGEAASVGNLEAGASAAGASVGRNMNGQKDSSGTAAKASLGGTTDSFTGSSSNGSGFRRGEFKKGGFSRGGDFKQREFKRSDNPDVLYGRDFDEEAMPIEEITGELGEVVIRGQIMSVESRELRNEKTQVGRAHV